MPLAETRSTIDHSELAAQQDLHVAAAHSEWQHIEARGFG
jgi:hypothetical protein